MAKIGPTQGRPTAPPGSYNPLQYRARKGRRQPPVYRCRRAHVEGRRRPPWDIGAVARVRLQGVMIPTGPRAGGCAARRLGGTNWAQ